MNLKIAHTVIDISPEKVLPLSGLKHREPHAPHLGIKECNLKIAWLSFGDEEHHLFFLADLLFFPNALAQEVSEYLLKNFNVPANNLIFAGTHTHSGPALGFLPWEKEQPAYLGFVFKKIIAALPALQKRKAVASLDQGAVEVKDISINRRLPIPYWKRGFKPKALMLPNLNGPVSEKVKVLQFEAEQGKKIWFLSYASHPVFNRNLELSSDYPGLLAQRIKDKGWADEVFVFAGFGGNVRPNYHGRGSWRTWMYGRNFAHYLPEHLDHFNTEMIQQLAKINFSTSAAPTSASSKEEIIDLISQSGKTQKRLSLKSLHFGTEISFLIANAEMFVQYEKSLPDNVFTISCTANCVGYVPTEDQVDLGGYEVEDAPLNNEMDGPISKLSLQAVVEKFKGLYSQKA